MSAYIVNQSVIKNIVIAYSLLQYEKNGVKCNLAVASSLATQLIKENVRSVNFRYSDNQEAEIINIVFGDVKSFKYDKFTVINDIEYLKYQSSECQNYNSTPAAILLNTIMNFIQFGCDPEIYKNKSSILHVGQKVYCKLYGGKTGYIYHINGNQNPSSCSNIAGFIAVGGSATFSVCWDNISESKCIPESILRGVQWKVYNEVISAKALINLRAEIIIKTQLDEINKKTEADIYTAKVTAIPLEYPYFIINDGKYSNAVLVAKNIRIALKMKFPKVKFSVRKSDHNCVFVSWIDGPKSRDVDEIINQFKSGRFNGMEDIYEYNNSPFKDVFGSINYVNSSREMSDSAIKKAISLMYKRLKPKFDKDGMKCPEVEQYKNGDLISWSLSGIHNCGGEDIQNEIRQELNGLSL